MYVTVTVYSVPDLGQLTPETNKNVAPFNGKFERGDEWITCIKSMN